MDSVVGIDLTIRLSDCDDKKRKKTKFCHENWNIFPNEGDISGKNVKISNFLIFCQQKNVFADFFFEKLIKKSAFDFLRQVLHDAMSNLLTFWTKKGKFYIVALSAGLPQPANSQQPPAVSRRLQTTASNRQLSAAASRSQQPCKQPPPVAASSRRRLHTADDSSHPPADDSIESVPPV